MNERNEVPEQQPAELLREFVRLYGTDRDGWPIEDGLIGRARAYLAAQPEPLPEHHRSDTVEGAISSLSFALAFALCNRDHGGTRRDVKKAQQELEDLCRLLKEKGAL